MATVTFQHEGKLIPLKVSTGRAMRLRSGRSAELTARELRALSAAAPTPADMDRLEQADAKRRRKGW